MGISFIFGIISTIYLFKVINVLNKEGIPSNMFDFMFSYNKFKKFVDNCTVEKKSFYTNLYKKALWFKRIPILLFICLLMLVYILSALK